jgi:hypothetical protein
MATTHTFVKDTHPADIQQQQQQQQDKFDGICRDGPPGSSREHVRFILRATCSKKSGIPPAGRERDRRVSVVFQDMGQNTETNNEHAITFRLRTALRIWICIK